MAAWRCGTWGRVGRTAVKAHGTLMEREPARIGEKEHDMSEAPAPEETESNRTDARCKKVACCMMAVDGVSMSRVAADDFAEKVHGGRRWTSENSTNRRCRTAQRSTKKDLSTRTVSSC